MTTELFKTVEETITKEGIEEKRTIAIEYILKDGDNEVGRLNVNEHGVNFNISKGFDVEGMATELLDIITLVQ